MENQKPKYCFLCLIVSAPMPAQQLYESQMRRRWKFSHRVVDHLSPEIKAMVRRLLEPTVKKRLRIDDVIEHQWFAMDTAVLNDMELADKVADTASQIVTGGSIIGAEQTTAMPNQSIVHKPAGSGKRDEMPSGATNHQTTVATTPATSPLEPAKSATGEMKQTIAEIVVEPSGARGSFLKPLIAKFNRSNTPKKVN